MQITINIDEKLFNDSGIGEAIKDSFNKLSKEDLSNIMKDIIHQYLSNEEILKGYFINKRYDNWKHNYEEYPSTEFISIINRIDLSKEMDDIKDKIINLLNNDINKILTDLFARTFINSISTMICNDDDFRNAISDSVNKQFSLLMMKNQ